MVCRDFSARSTLLPHPTPFGPDPFSKRSKQSSDLTTISKVSAQATQREVPLNPKPNHADPGERPHLARHAPISSDAKQEWRTGRSAYMKCKTYLKCMCMHIAPSPSHSFSHSTRAVRCVWTAALPKPQRSTGGTLQAAPFKSGIQPHVIPPLCQE